jgi:hypothetical protein
MLSPQAERGASPIRSRLKGLDGKYCHTILGTFICSFSANGPFVGATLVITRLPVKSLDYGK